jgi:opacity protein-like surface antigen
VEQARKIILVIEVAALSCMLFFSGSALMCQPVDSLLNQAEQWKNRNLIKGLTVEAYIDVYYVGNIGGTIPTSHTFEFQSNSPYINQVRVNMLDIDMQYKNRWARAAADIRFGDQPQLLAHNTTAEWINYVHELSLGFRIYKGLWFDCGYLESPVGVESSRPIDNLLSTCTVGSYYEPSTLLGAALSFITPDEKWEFTGWAGNPFTVPFGHSHHVMFGFDLNFNPTDDLTVSYNTALGNTAPEGASFNRYYFFNNLFARWDPAPRWNLIAQADLAFKRSERKVSDSVKGGSMVSGLIGVKYWVHPKFSLALRGEMFYDPENILIGDAYTGLTNQFMIFGCSAGVEFKPFSDAYIRLQYNWLTTGDPGVKPFNEVDYPDGSYWADYSRQDFVVTMGVRF